MQPPVLLLTRPADQSQTLARRMQGLAEVQIAPVSRIVPLDWDRGLAQGVRGLILTSANAVPQVAHLAPLPAWCVGDATARAAAQAGFAAVASPHKAADGRALVAAMAEARPEGPFLHAHGQHLAMDVGAALADAGIAVRSAAVYAAEMVPWAPGLAGALAGRRIVAPLYSPRAAAAVSARLAGVPFGALVMVAISPAAAARVVPITGAELAVADHPGAMEAAIRDALAAQP